MATKNKAQKKRKLRNAEYYDLQEMQDRLYADSQQGKIFYHLVELASMPENIRLAYRNIKTNPGSKTAGTDGRAVGDEDASADSEVPVAREEPADKDDKKSLAEADPKEEKEQGTVGEETEEMKETVGEETEETKETIEEEIENDYEEK